MRRDEIVNLGNSCFAAQQSKEMERSLLREEGLRGFFSFVFVYRMGEITACFYVDGHDSIGCEKSYRWDRRGVLEPSP